MIIKLITKGDSKVFQYLNTDKIVSVRNHNFSKDELQIKLDGDKYIHIREIDWHGYKDVIRWFDNNAINKRMINVESKI